MDRKGFSLAIAIGIIAVVIVIAAVGYFLWKNSTASGDLQIGLKTYTSKNLGLLFQYWQDGNYLINETGTMLTMTYAYPGNSTQTAAMGLMVMFNKTPQTSFLQSVEDLLSSQDITGNCELKTVSSGTNYMPPAFTQQIEAFDAAPAKYCGYGSLNYDDNGDAYFAYNSNYPDRFYFYDFGNGGGLLYPDDNDRGDWMTTIRLIDLD